MNKELINVRDSHRGLFNTQSGQLVDLNNPSAEMINSEDIAYALSRICRFGGHTSSFYSVAEHSLLVAALAPDEIKLEALMHDAAEAYLGDVIKPLKNILGDSYKQLEIAFEAVINAKYALDPDKLKQVKPLDLMALDYEHEAFLSGSSEARAVIGAYIAREANRPVDRIFDIPELFLDQLQKYLLLNQ